MTSTTCAGPNQAAAERPTLGREHEEAAEFVGRTGVPASGRALVPTALSPPREAASTSRPPLASFLAQLIATAQQAPQTRARRRAEPDHASAVYDAAVARCIDEGGTVCRTLWA